MGGPCDGEPPVAGPGDYNRLPRWLRRHAAISALNFIDMRSAV